jgi:hypothetical protein
MKIGLKNKAQNKVKPATKSLLSMPKVMLNAEGKPIVKKGVWVERPRRMEILVCVCGNKYLKTRKDQVVCVKCINVTLFKK